MADLTFTAAQERAITDRGGAVLVSAAAGSGKTRVLVERLLRRVLDPVSPCNIDDFLVITFTKKAAQELRTRIAAKLAERMALEPDNRHLARQAVRLSLAQITTIDGFCSELVRANAFALHLSPDFRQLEPDEEEDLRAHVAAVLLEERYEKSAEDADFLHLVNTLGVGRNDNEIAEDIQSLYDSAQCHLFPERWMDECSKQLDVSQTEDAAQTPWGQRVIEEFHNFCRGKISLLRCGLRLAEQDPLVIRCYGPALESDIAQLNALCKLDTWESLHQTKLTFVGLLTCSSKDPETVALRDQVQKLRNSSKNALKERMADFASDSATVLNELAQTGRALTALFALTKDFSRAYDREKRRLRVMDFSDLEHSAVQLLLHPDGSPRPLARELSTRYTEIMLDEYQDTNEVQDRMFAAISREGKNLFMVGDVKQAIYRFRLADPGIFLEKYRTYLPVEQARDGQPRKILLSQNFRSDKGILDAVNAVFTACMDRQTGELDYGEEEMLRQGMPRTEIPRPVTELYCIDTKPKGSAGNAPDKDETEAAFVAAKIREMLDTGVQIVDGETTRPVQPEDIVILLRSMKSTAPVYRNALRSQGIACQSDLESSLFDAPEIESLVSLLQIIDNPRQDVPLAAALLSPLFGMSADVLAQIRAENLAETRAQGRTDDLYTALERSAHPQAVAFVRTLTELRAQAQQLDLSELLTVLTDRLQLEELCMLAPDSAQRLNNLQSFFATAAAFCASGQKSLSQFLARLDRMKVEQQSLQPERGSVRLMSIHKSKGLEFPVVVLADLSLKFNDSDSKKQVLLHPELGAGCNVYDEASHSRYHSIAKRAILSQRRAEQRAEEMRILYVAMTRAKDRLIMTYCRSGLDTKLASLSQRLTNPPEPELAMSATCMGDWVLEAALLRTEAGELFSAGEHPTETQVSEISWRICYRKVDDLQADAQTAQPVAAIQTEQPDEAALLEALSFRYPQEAATGIPSKITATQLKGRTLDEEVTDDRPQRSAHTLRQPNFTADRPLTPAQKGVATHLAMQYLDFAKTGSIAGIEAELARLVAQTFLTKKQAEAVTAERIFRIFAGSIGQKIRAADQVVREFKFSILTDASIYDESGRGEQMLLQGVTDCCLLKDGKLTVIDFKTDRVRPGEEAQAAERYRAQLDAYSLALSRIFELPVEEKLLYFFETDTVVRL